MKLLALGLMAAAVALPQPRPTTMMQGAHRMEIALERLDGEKWTPIDPGLVLAQGDRVRFRFRTNFDGYLYVMNQGTSGKYEQLFPREETGQDNAVSAEKDYNVPATSTSFRIEGPAGYETVYWMIMPARLTDAPPRLGPPPAAHPSAPIKLLPRCDSAVMRARGDCIDTSAGPRMVPRGEAVPGNLPQAAGAEASDLVFVRENQTAVIASPTALTGPVIYQFRLAHR